MMSWRASSLADAAGCDSDQEDVYQSPSAVATTVAVQAESSPASSVAAVGTLNSRGVLITPWVRSTPREFTRASSNGATGSAWTASSSANVSSMHAIAAPRSTCNSPRPLSSPLAAMVARRLADQPRTQLIDFLGLLLLDAECLTPVNGRVDPHIEYAMFEMVELFPGGGVEAVIDALLTLDEAIRPTTFQQVLPALTRHVHKARKPLGYDQMADALQGDPLLHDDLEAAAFSGISSIPASRYNREHEHELLSSYLATTNVVGLVTQQELDHMLTVAGGLAPLVEVLDTWHLAESPDSPTRAQDEDVAHAPRFTTNPPSPFLVSDLIDRLYLHKWPHGSPPASLETRLALDAEFPQTSDINDNDRETAQETVLDLLIMNHATESVIFTAEILNSLIQAARGLFPLCTTLLTLSSQRNFKPQNLLELIFLVENARLERAALLAGLPPTRRGQKSFQPLHVQIERAQRDVARQDRAAAKAAARAAAIAVAAHPDVHDAHDPADEDAVIAGDGDDGDVDADSAVFVDPDEDESPSQLEFVLSMHNSNGSDHAAADSPDGRLNRHQRQELADAIIVARLMERCCVDVDDIKAMDLDRLTPDLRFGIHSACAHACNALLILGMNQVRARNFDHLVSLTKQHYAHSQPQPPRSSAAHTNRRRRNPCVIL